jgi:hypothetical protein
MAMYSGPRLLIGQRHPPPPPFSHTTCREYSIPRSVTGSRQGAHCPIHPSAWKKKRNSRKFAVASDPPILAPGTPRRHGVGPSTPKRGDLVAFVAPSCIKALRLATSQLPENSCPIGPGPTELSLNGVLGSSPVRSSLTFGSMVLEKLRPNLHTPRGAA